MEKKWLCLLQSVLLRFMCFVIAFSIILLNTSIESSASDIINSTINKTYKVSQSNIFISNCYLPSDYEWIDDGSNYDDNFDFWYLGESKALFNADSSVYGYRIEMTRTVNNGITLGNCKYSRWLMGTQNDLLKGSHAVGFDNVSASSNNVWIPTNYSTEMIKYAPLFKFYGDSPGSYSIDCEYTFTISAYRTKSEYQSALASIGNKLDTQTSEMKEQNAELDKQTTELKEQTAQQKEQTTTQKSMLSKMSDFFGSFFDNLKNSVISLFIPTSQEMGDLFSRLNDFFNEKFGFLFYPFDFIIEVFDIFLTADSSTGITFPAFELMGYQIWDSYTYDIGSDETVGVIFGYVRLVTGSVLGFAFITYLRNFFDKRFGGGGS